MDSKLIDSEIEWSGKIPQTWEIVPIKTLLKKKKILETRTDENVLSLTMNRVAGLERVSSKFILNYYIPKISLDQGNSIADFLDKKISNLRIRHREKSGAIDKS